MDLETIIWNYPFREPEKLKKENLQYLWDTIKRNTIDTMGVPEGAEKEKGADLKK